MKPFQTTFLNIAIVISFIFLGIVISPFITTLILAAIFVTGAYPFYEWVLDKVRGRKRVAALLVSLSIGVVFSTLFFVFFLTLSQEAVSTYQGFEQWIKAGKFNLNDITYKASKYVGVQPIDLTSSIIQAAQTFSSTLVSQSANLLKNVAWFILNLLLMVFAMYFFFKDGKYIVESIKKITPLPHTYGTEIFQKFRQVSLAMIYGVFFTAIAQGVLGGIGLSVAGIRNPIFWGTVMGFFGMLPIGGTGIVWLPAGILLIMEGSYFAGVGLLIWGALVVAFVDNLIKPIIIAKQAKTYPLATFIVVIGGLMIFGLKGAIIAPMVLAALVSLIHIYELERG